MKQFNPKEMAEDIVKRFHFCLLVTPENSKKIAVKCATVMVLYLTEIKTEQGRDYWNSVFIELKENFPEVVKEN